MNQSGEASHLTHAVPIVQMQRISKAFNGVRVLHEVDFELERGEVHALVGGNGAGKSTLMKILQGVYRPDGGEIHIDGGRIRLDSTHQARRLGIGMVFQEFSLIPSLTVAENVFLEIEPRLPGGWLDDRSAIRDTAVIFATMGVEVDPRARLGTLSTAHWQLTEIAKALAQSARVLIMDEPTASLAKHEADALFVLVDRLKARGIAVVYITHRLDEVLRLTDRTTVLKDGDRMLTTRTRDLTLEQLVGLVTGRAPSSPRCLGEPSVTRNRVPLLEVRNLSCGSRLRNISFQLNPGEILGLAGRLGSGRSRLARCLFGLERPESGEIWLHGHAIALTHPEVAIRAGLALVPEDRRLQGLVLDHSVRDNLRLALLARSKRQPQLRSSGASLLEMPLIAQLGIRVRSLDAKVRTLSGGNQQKVVIAKWLLTDPDVLLMDEPTVGIDVASRNDIHGMTRSFANSGKGVMLISSDLHELVEQCGRILVLRDGAVAQELEGRTGVDEAGLELAVQGV